MDCGPRRRRHSSAPPDRSSGARAAAGQSNGDHGVHRTPAGPAAVLRGCHATRPGPGHRPGQSPGRNPARRHRAGSHQADQRRLPPPAHAPADQDPQKGWTAPGPSVGCGRQSCGDATGAIPGLNPSGLEPACHREARCGHSQRTTPGQTEEQSEPAEAWNEKTTPEQANQGVILLKRARHRLAAAAARSRGSAPTDRSSHSTVDATGSLRCRAGRQTTHHRPARSAAAWPATTPSA